VVSGLIGVDQSLGVIANRGVGLSGAGVSIGGVGMGIGCFLVLRTSNRVARLIVNVAVGESTSDMGITRMASLQLEDIARHAVRIVWRMVEGHWHARTQCSMSRMRHRSHYHVMTCHMSWRHRGHDDVGVIDLTASTELLRRLHIHNIARIDGNRHGLHLIKDSGDAQACKTKIDVNHNE